MHRRVLIVIACSAVIGWGQSVPQSTTRTNPATTKDQVLASANKVALVGALGYVARYGIAMNPTAKKAKESLEREVRKWGRFTIVEDQKQAELVLVLYEGNRGIIGGGVIRTARLAVTAGGRDIKPGETSLWDRTEDGTLIGGSGAPKVIARFRDYLESLDRTLLSSTQTLPTGETVSTNSKRESSIATAETSSQKTEDSAAQSVQRAESGQPANVFEVIGKAKTYAVRGKSSLGGPVIYEKPIGMGRAVDPDSGSFFNYGKYADVQRGMKEVFWQMESWGRMRYVQEVSEADLVFVVYQWDSRAYSRQFHGIRSVIQVSEGRDAFERTRSWLWTSGTSSGSAKELVDNLRFELDLSTSLQGIQPSHQANKSYNRGCDRLDAAEKRDGDGRTSALYEAIGELRKSLREDYAYAPTHERLGTALRELGLHANAKYEYKIALQLQPTMKEAMEGLRVMGVAEDVCRPSSNQDQK